MVSPAVGIARNRGRSGFSLVELMVAIVILSVGVLSMAGTSTWVVRQVTLSWITTERAAARQSAIETIFANSYEDARGGSGTFGEFDVDWTLVRDAGSYKTFRVVTVGLGKPEGALGMTTLSTEVADTVLLTYASPGF